MLCETLTVVGVGLIGGSIGLAAQKRGIARRVVGIGRNGDSLRRAREVGAIHQGMTLEEGLPDRSDLFVICTPVDQIAMHVRAIASGCPANALITDAGSTKSDIVRDLDGHVFRGHFVGSHPLAGSEKRGPEHASADLFEGRVTVVTPTVKSDPGAVERTISFWRALGSEVRLLDPETHDRALATTSHLPHLVAAALAGALPAEWRTLAATGFRDTTRIAGGDPGLWTAIFLSNRLAMTEAVRPFAERLAALLDAIDHDDAVRLAELLTEAKQVRDALGS